MTFDEPFEIDFHPVVHAKLRAELHQRLKSTQKILISERIDDNHTRKVNTIKLGTKFGHYPPEPVDEICEAVAAVMDVAWRSQEVDDDHGLPPMTFVVVCEHLEHKAAGKPRRPRSQFTFTYHAEDHAAYEEVDAGTGHPLERIVDLQNAHILQLQSMLYEGHRTLMTAVENFGQSSTSGAKIMGEAVPLFIAGMQANLNAAMMAYSDKKAEREASEHGKRLGEMLKMGMPYLGILGGQLIGKFTGMDPSAFSTVAGHQAQAAAGVDEDDPEPTASATYATTPEGVTYDTTATEAPAEEAVGDTGPAPDGHELAQFAYVFGNQLRPDQHQKFNQILTKKQVGAFYDLFCAKSDDEAYAAYMTLMSVAAVKVGELNAVLDDQQREWFGHFMKKAAEYGSVNQ